MSDLSDYKKWVEKCEKATRQQRHAAIAEKFYDEVCTEAEANMLKTGKLEGSHFAAMQTVLKRWKGEESK